VILATKCADEIDCVLAGILLETGVRAGDPRLEELDVDATRQAVTSGVEVPPA
jgi:hypothetical protein